MTTSPSPTSSLLLSTASPTMGPTVPDPVVTSLPPIPSWQPPPTRPPNPISTSPPLDSYTQPPVPTSPKRPTSSTTSQDDGGIEILGGTITIMVLIVVLFACVGCLHKSERSQPHHPTATGSPGSPPDHPSATRQTTTADRRVADAAGHPLVSRNRRPPNRGERRPASDHAAREGWETRLILKRVLAGPASRTDRDMDTNSDMEHGLSMFGSNDVNDMTTTASYRTEHPKQDIVLPTTETCEICLEDYQAGDEIAYNRHPQCHHVYHKDCLVGWLVAQPGEASHACCPVCRHPY